MTNQGKGCRQIGQAREAHNHHWGRATQFARLDEVTCGDLPIVDAISMMVFLTVCLMR